MKIILASQSPYRKHALEVLGLRYETNPSEIDELKIRHSNPRELAKLLSKAKAIKVGEKQKNAVIVAADLFVVYKNKIFEKPLTVINARKMLKTLSGKTFEIVTGIAVYNSKTKKMSTASEVCRVKFRVLSNYEINDYIARYPAIKCAGAFEADGLLRFAEKISGNYNFKAALPVNKLVLFLRKNKVTV